MNPWKISPIHGKKEWGSHRNISLEIMSILIKCWEENVNHAFALKAFLMLAQLNVPTKVLTREKETEKIEAEYQLDTSKGHLTTTFCPEWL